MQLGFVSAILADKDLEDVVATAADIGYDCVEVLCWPRGKAERRYAGVTHVDVVDLTADAARRVRDVMGSIDISALGYYPNPLVADEEEANVYADHIRKVIDAAVLLDVDTVTSFVGRDPAKSVEANWPRFLEVWRPIVAYAAERDVRIAIENCPMLFTSDEWPGGKNLAFSPSVWRRMFEDIPSDHFGLNFDPSHMIWMQMDYLKALRDFSEKLFHVHAKDARIDRHRLAEVGILATPLEFHTPKLPGLGDVDWGAFFSTLTDTGYDGPVCVEVEDRAFEGSPEARTRSLRQSAAYLRRFVTA